MPNELIVKNGLKVDTTTGALTLPVLTTTQRDAISSPAAGMSIYNSTNLQREYYDGSSWTSGPKNVTNRQTASYTLVIGDSGKLVEMNVASANNLTVPPNSSVAFGVGTSIDIVQYGAGQTTIVAGSGVTLLSAGTRLKIAEQYAAVTLIKIATDTWYVIGSTVA